MPKVSVVVPCYNMEKYIERCLDSLQKQLLEDIEIICVDDKSTDSTPEILKSRAESDPRIHIIQQEKNMGVAVARNTGIDNATGEYIGFVDADDYVDIDFYQKIYNHAVKTGAELAKGLLTVIENGHRFIPPTNDHAKRRKIRFCYDFTSAIYKTDFLNKHNLRFMEGVTLGEDITFLIKAAYLCNDLAICPYATSYYYVIRQGSANTTVSKDKVDSVITIVNHMMDYANTAANMPKEDYDFIVWFVLDVLAKNIAKAGFEDKKPMEDTMLKVLRISKNKKDTNISLCDVFGTLANRLFDKYIPHKTFLDIMKKNNPDSYNIYAKQIISEKSCGAGILNITETQAYTKLKLFGALPIYTKYKGNKPVKKDDFSVKLVDGMPKISIIVPFYNNQRYIGECLSALTQQTLQDIEIVCVDDCGIDSSRKIVEQIAQKDKRIKIIKNNKKSGVAYSKNIGVKHAGAPYIMFCDANDTLKEDACEKLFNALQQSNADIIACSTDIKYEEGDEKQPDEIYLKVTANGAFDMNKQIQMSCNVHTFAKVFKRQIICEKGLEFPVGVNNEDDFFYTAYCAWVKRIALTSEALYIKRNKKESMTSRLNDKKAANLDPLQAAIRYIKYCKKHGIWYREKYWFWDVMFTGLFSVTLRMSAPIYRKACFDCARKYIRRYYSDKGMPQIIQMKIKDIKNGN